MTEEATQAAHAHSGTFAGLHSHGGGELHWHDEFGEHTAEEFGVDDSLRDYDWNFQSAWNTDLMKARRKEAGAGCYCTHESNCYYPSLPFNPGHLVKIKKLESQMKKAAKEMSFAAAKEIALKA